MGDGGDERRAQQAAISPPKGTNRCMTQRELAAHQTEHPFRRLSVVDEHRPARVEAAHCGWCRFIRDNYCYHPCYGGRNGRWDAVNPRGECPHYEPSRWTKILHGLGLGRSPVMVDPRVWDKEDTNHE